MKEKDAICSCCGDSAVTETNNLTGEVQESIKKRLGILHEKIVLTVKKKPTCLDCWLELTTGEIPPASRITGDGSIGGNIGDGRKESDPWGENAVRHLEDG